MDIERVTRIASAALAAAVFSLIAGSAASAPIVGAPIIVQHDGNVTATYRGNTASFSNDLYLFSPAGSFAGIIFNNHASPIGSSVSLGNFTAGTELIFRLHVNNTGFDFFTGDFARNPDGKFHARINDTYSATETLVEFEDLFDTPEFPGGFNDLAFSFTNVQSGNVIPEPSTYALLLAGLGLVLVASRRHLNQAERLTTSTGLMRGPAHPFALHGSSFDPSIGVACNCKAVNVPNHRGGFS